MPLQLDLAGRRAMVTGGASGIGLSCAEQLSAAGAHVVVVDRDSEGAARASRRLESTGGQSSFAQLDVSSWQECADFAASSADDGWDILVNCAATWTLGSFVESQLEEREHDLAVTLQGPLNLTRALLPGMIERRQGCIINIGSDAGRIGEPGQVVYSAAKSGVIGFTKSLAKEAGPHGVRVNCVSPALTRTPASQAYIDSVPAHVLERQYPLRRLGLPEDVAYLVTFLASDLAGFITGQVISVNGGYATPG
jgi:2-hydroxycyclohexanecarboxyl-CoA dehydrogenase